MPIAFLLVGKTPALTSVLDMLIIVNYLDTQSGAMVNELV